MPAVGEMARRLKELGRSIIAKFEPSCWDSGSKKLTCILPVAQWFRGARQFRTNPSRLFQQSLMDDDHRVRNFRKNCELYDTRCSARRQAIVRQRKAGWYESHMLAGTRLARARNGGLSKGVLQ